MEKLIHWYLYKKFKKQHRVLLNKYYVDELYDRFFVQNAKNLGEFLWRSIDAIFIDGLPNGAAYLSRSLARVAGVVQTGFIYHYAFGYVAAVMLILLWLFWKIQGYS